MIERVVVINDISEAKGGATALALASAFALRARGLPVTYLTGDSGENHALMDAGVAVVGLGAQRLTASSKARAFAAGLYNSAARAMVSAWIAANDTPGTVYHLHGWAQILSPAVFSALKPVMARTVIHAHDFFLVCPNGSFAFLKTGEVCPLVPLSTACIGKNCDRRHYAHKLWRVARQIALKRICDSVQMPAVLAIHEAMRAFLVRGGIPASTIETVPNPVQPYSVSRIAAEHNREFLFIGRLEATKGPDLAAAAARSAGVIMRFIGDGALRAALEVDFPEMVFDGHRLPVEIPSIAADARALVMPSRYPEPYGLVAAEALWSGLPVVAAETAFLSTDIVAVNAGAAVDPRDTAAFAAILRGIANDDSRTASMSIAAFERTRGIGLTQDAWIDRLIVAYCARLDAVCLVDAA